MVSAVSVQGDRPYAPPNRQTVCKLVTSSPKTTFPIPFPFNLLRTLSEMRFPQLAYYQSLPHSLHKTPEVGTPPQDLPFVFKRFRTLAHGTSVRPGSVPRCLCGHPHVPLSPRRRPVGAPLFSHGKRTPSLFCSYRCQTPSFPPRG